MNINIFIIERKMHEYENDLLTLNSEIKIMNINNYLQILLYWMELNS
jgi:hypothetical protein